MKATRHNTAGDSGSQESELAAEVSGLFTVRHITYHNEENGYAVLRLVPSDGDHSAEFVAVGIFGQPRTGQCYHIKGVWKQNPQYGPQVVVSSATPQLPRSLQAIERYLAGSSIHGLGPHFAHLLVSHFEEETLDVIRNHPERLQEVAGIGPARASAIVESWQAQEGLQEIMIKLQGSAGLTPRQAQRVYQAYQREAWQVISHDPYRLAEDVRGFGFKRCDQIAQALGIDRDAPERLQAGLIYVLQSNLAEGHLWTASDAATAEAAELLSVAPTDVAEQTAALAQQERIVATDAPSGEAEALYLPQVYHTERRTAHRLAALLHRPSTSRLGLDPDAAAQLARHRAPELTAEQLQAVQATLTGKRLTILTGGPGTGKTTTLRALIACLESIQISYALCATTGRAAKQLAQATGRPAATVHRHLGIGFGSGSATDKRLKESLLIIDEASMIDIWLMDQIVASLSPANHLVLVGDIDQLPSVGPGAVLQDLIRFAEQKPGGGVHVTRLSQIFRQEAGAQSMIVVNCHRVRRGQRPINDVPPTSDYFEMLRDNPVQARELILSLASQRLPRHLDIPPQEVQVLTPMHGGPVGTLALNHALQNRLNPPHEQRPEIIIGRSAEGRPRRVLRLGDKVRQTRNDYDKRVFNGDLGIISSVNVEDGTLTVQFDDISATYGDDDLDELQHAWAMTIHSAQGSQWPAVVTVMLTAHYVMLERNILYTALSRAQRLAVLVTQEKAVRMAIGNQRSTNRRTTLLEELQEVDLPLLHPSNLRLWQDEE